MSAATAIAVVLIGSACMTALPLFAGLFGRRRPMVSTAPTRRSLPLADWHSRELHDLSEAEDLLDMLEACGTAERELVVHGNADFEVRWR
jgi:hypothetical protein